jgi:hypothetical protein
MFFIVNANRPEAATLESAMAHLESIQRVSNIKVTALVNNTHLVKQTTLSDIMKGQQLCHELSSATGLPIRYVSLMEHLADQLPEDLEGTIFPITLIIRESWMS